MNDLPTWPSDQRLAKVVLKLDAHDKRMRCRERLQVFGGG
jgi:hypothetical protein